jgi:hypothetical protein
MLRKREWITEIGVENKIDAQVIILFLDQSQFISIAHIKDI